MAELIDLLNDKGELTGKTTLKSHAHKKGLLHASVHIWIFDDEKNVLIQKRASTKDTFPNLWDISVAGHISAGEEPVYSALRETKEEVGISITENQLHFIGTSTNKIHHREHLIDYELHHIYVCNINFNVENLKIQEEEVAEIKKTPLISLIKEIEKKTNSFVPHGKSYYKKVFNKIANFKII